MKATRTGRMVAGFTLVELMAVGAILSQIPSANYTQVKQRAKQIVCMQQLQQIGKLLQMYVISNDKYPNAAFFPKDPFAGQDSIRVILEGHASAPRVGRRGGGASIWVCPSEPEALKKKGLTYVYNDALAGKRNLRNPSKKWVLIEVNCVSAKAPKPHPGGYNILFADGHVITSNRLPRKITQAHRAAIEKFQREHLL